eukprot:4567806-Amphidinium_carterae.2
MPCRSSASTVTATKRPNKSLSQCTQAIDLDDSDDAEEDGKEKVGSLEEAVERLLAEEDVKLESADPEDLVAREMHGDDV